MKENEKQIGNATSRKEKIRQRYKGIDAAQLDVIPAVEQENFYAINREQRVAIYARVSTDDPRQTSSYELQKNHYQDVVSRHPGWRLIDIYADEGISGTSLQHRNAFIKMIKDCEDGKIDLIVTKSVSRFARNVLDCIGYVRQLKELKPPVGIFFETENIYTLNENSEMSLSFISTLAQEESHTKSEIMNASIEMRFRRGIFLTPPLLGYDQDENGNLVINEEEAKTVRLIFFMYLYGYTCQEIADTLTKLNRSTKLGNKNWNPNSILNVLTNERHCGDVLARKTWTPNYLNHKSKKNNKDRNQYRQKNHHEAIVSRDDFIAVQRLISNAKYGNKGILPELHVIDEGILRGFVSVNPRWAGFKAKDYKHASESVYEKMTQIHFDELKVNSGDFDLRKYEVARAQFFDNANKICITISLDSIKFSTECVRKFESNYIEILVHPDGHFLAVRPSSKEKRNAMQWSKQHNGQAVSKPISGAAFLQNLFELFKWEAHCKYRIIGVRRQNNDEAIIFFNIQDAEVLIPKSTIEISKENLDSDISKAIFDDDIKPLGTKSSVFAYPEDWVHSFGDNYYRQSQAMELMAYSKTGKWNSQLSGVTFNPEPLNVTRTEKIEENIESIVDSMKQEGRNE